MFSETASILSYMPDLLLCYKNKVIYLTIYDGIFFRM